MRPLIDGSTDLWSRVDLVGQGQGPKTFGGDLSDETVQRVGMSSIVRGRRPIPADVDRTTGRYLLAVHRLADGSAERVSTGALREALDVTAASVTEMIGKLDDRGYLDHEKYAGVRLTDDGRDAATRLAWRVCVVRTFFDAELGTDPSPARTYEVGYAFPPAGLERLHELVDGPCIDHCPEAGPADRDCPA